MKFIFKDTVKNTELVLPITPKSYQIEHGINVETININSIGDVSLAGFRTVSSIKVDCILPARAYPFNQPNIDLNPFNYISKFETWCDNHTVLRFIISDTIVNTSVIIEDVLYGEQDGTGDLYCTLNLKTYYVITKPQTSNTGNASREINKYTSQNAEQSYVIKDGDTLSAICRKFYGDSSLYPKLGKYNNIKNYNLIFPNQVLKIPSKNLL